MQLGYGIEGGQVANIGGAIGTGSFTSNYSASLVASGRDHSLRDLNGDGILDLVSLGAAHYTVARGNGDGTFQAGTAVLLSTSLAQSHTLADLNNDGTVDLLVSYSDAVTGASVHLGNGDGTFSTGTNYQTELQGSLEVGAGDVNGDGILDLVTVGLDAVDHAYVTTRLGTGSGTFGAATSVLVAAGVNNALRLDLGDINNDGLIDIAVGVNIRGASGIRIMTGSSSGTFSTGASYSILGSGAIAATAVDFVDLNGDGQLDLAVSGSSSVEVRLGSATGSFGVGTSYFQGGTVNGIGLSDVNGDGVVDLAATVGTNIRVRLGTGGGAFGNLSNFSSGAMTGGPLSFGDITGDGVTDIVATGSGAANLTAFAATTVQGVAPLQAFSLRTKVDARDALGIANRTLTNLDLQRGTIGAAQSRLSSALNVLRSGKEEHAAARSRIVDADVAVEVSELLRLQILQNAGVALLAQTNLQPAVALKLIQ